MFLAVFIYVFVVFFDIFLSDGLIIFLLIFLLSYGLWLMFAVFAGVTNKEKNINALLKGYNCIRGRWFTLLTNAMFPILGLYLTFLIFSNYGFEFLAFIVIFLSLPVIINYEHCVFMNAKETSKSIDCENGRNWMIVLFGLGIVILIVVYNVLIIHAWILNSAIE